MSDPEPTAECERDWTSWIRPNAAAPRFINENEVESKLAALRAENERLKQTLGEIAEELGNLARRSPELYLDEKAARRALKEDDP